MTTVPQIPRFATFTFVFVEVDPLTELGAPADPSNLTVEMGFSQTAHPAVAPPYFAATWTVNTKVTPTRYAACCSIGSDGIAGQFALGLWYPFVRVRATPEISPLRGAPFRVV